MIRLNGKAMDVSDVVRIARDREKVEIDPANREIVKQSRAVVKKYVKEKKIVYGITTGFGHFADIVIPQKHNRELQKNLLMSHATGTGPVISDDKVRAMMALRVNALIKGYSGIRWVTLQRMVDFLNEDILPVIPQKGSVGASGDLVPLAHMSLPLIGLGRVRFRGVDMEAGEALQKMGRPPLILEAKEGLALINGTQMMTAVGALNAFDGQMLCRLADVASACSIEALRGTDAPFDPRIHELRPFSGQQITALNIRKLLKDSRILESHRTCSKVQDAYSLRCIPQVHGATRDTVRYVTSVLETEMNSVTDNPIIFPDTGQSISGGNFHGQPVALALDFLGIGTAELANISERRIERLVDPALSQLPPFLTKDGGLNSGYMITQYTAAALVSENKILAHPASVDSIPTSANQEDHVSMGTIAAFKGAEIIKNVRDVIAIELMCAVQGLDFIEERPGTGVQAARELIRSHIPTLTSDRVMAYDLQSMNDLLMDFSLIEAVEEAVGPLD
jgi:histidine ammonia-lyase